MKVYDRNMSDRSASSLVKIKSLITQSESVLDIGCGAGDLGEALKKDKKAHVIGVEYDAASFDIASRKLDQVFAIDLNWQKITDIITEKFDTVILADIIEHIYYPDQLLAEAKRCLKPNGRLIISIPNAAYLGAILNLYDDEWTYGEEGILDSTHIRFYTKKSILNLLHEAGFDAAVVDHVIKDLLETEFRGRIDSLASPLRDWLVSKDNAMTYQFIIEARPFEQQSNLVEVISESPVCFSFLTKLYYSALPNHVYDEKDIVFCHGQMGRDNQMKYSLTSNAIRSIRFYYADRKSRYNIDQITVYSGMEIIWQSGVDVADLSFSETVHLTDRLPLHLFANHEKAYVNIEFSKDLLGQDLSIVIKMSAPIAEDNLSFYSTVSEDVYLATVNEMKQSMLLYADAVRYNENLSVTLTNTQKELLNIQKELLKAQEKTLILEQVSEQLEASHKEIYASLSWRITAPIRKLKQLLTQR